MNGNLKKCRIQDFWFKSLPWDYSVRTRLYSRIQHVHHLKLKLFSLLLQCEKVGGRVITTLASSRRKWISGDNSKRQSFWKLSVSFLQRKSPKITVWLNCTWSDWSCSTSQLSFWIRSELGAKPCQDGRPTIANHHLHWAPVFPQTIQIHSGSSEDLQSILGSSCQGKK